MNNNYLYAFVDTQIHQDEVFKQIDFFSDSESRYYISNYGNVYSAHHNRFIKPIVNTYGYFYVNLGADNRQFVHRLVAKAFVPGESNERNCVNHIDGNKQNNYYRNLEWCTKGENNAHAYATNLNTYIGENCRDAKLTNDQVHTICKLLQDNMPIRDILEHIGLEFTMNNYEIIRSIRKGYAWKSISQYYNFGDTSYISGSIPENLIVQICEMFENGKTIKEVIEVLENGNPIYYRDSKFYNSVSNIKRRRAYKEISKNFKF